MSFTVLLPNLGKALKDISSYADGVASKVKRGKAITGINIQRKAVGNINSYGSRPVKRGKDKAAKNTQYLVQTGAMRASIMLTFKSDFSDLNRSESLSSQSSTSSASLAKSTTGDVTGVGTGVEYAVHHEFGAPRANIPARPFLHPAAESERSAHIRRMKEATKL
jgi:phage gpG-like protein